MIGQSLFRATANSTSCYLRITFAIQGWSRGKMGAQSQTCPFQSTWVYNLYSQSTLEMDYPCSTHVLCTSHVFFWGIHDLLFWGFFSPVCLFVGLLGVVECDAFCFMAKPATWTNLFVNHPGVGKWDGHQALFSTISLGKTDWPLQSKRICPLSLSSSAYTCLCVEVLTFSKLLSI